MFTWGEGRNTSAHFKLQPRTTLQAIIQALSDKEESVKEILVSREKVCPVKSAFHNLKIKAEI